MFLGLFPEGVKVGRGIGAATKEKDCDLQPLKNIPCNVILYQPPSRFWSYLNSFFKIHKLYYGWLIQILVEWEFWGRKQPQFSRMVFQFSSETVNPLKMWWTYHAGPLFALTKILSSSRHFRMNYGSFLSRSQDIALACLLLPRITLCGRGEVWKPTN